MAEAFLNPIIQSLIHLLKDEVKSLKGIKKQVESLKRELEIIEALLKDADSRANREDLINDAVKIWMKQLREEANHTRDFIDEYRWHVAQCTTDKTGFIGFFCKIGGRIKTLKSRHLISSQLQDIIESLQVGQGFGLSQSLQAGSSGKTSYTEECSNRFGAHFVEEDEEYVDVPLFQGELKSFLVEGESELMVLSLVGEGGIGKTTLANKVYNEVKHIFDYHAWITVSQSYDVKILLQNMMKQMGLVARSTSTSSYYDMVIQELITPLRKHLQTKRYVIIFYDIWDTDFWEKIKYALPGNNNGSRVVITTRNETVAPCDDLIQRLETWTHNMAYELFCKKIFRCELFRGRCPEELEILCHKIIQKCQGLPLAIEAIAGLLSRKKKVQFEWQKVLDNIDFEFKTNPHLLRILKILSLSYHDLSYHLKPCLLFFGIFPEDFVIEKERLRQLWISEGFVQARDGKPLKEEVERYLNELVERSLVSTETLYGPVKGYKVHDLMHEFITSKVKDLCFCQIFSKNNVEFDENKHYCRLSIRGGSMPETITKTMQQYTTVRSIFLLLNSNDNELVISNKFLIALFQKLKLLKILDLANAPVDHLPKELGNLFHLRYLNLSGTNIKVLPESIGKLHDLHYLILENTQVDKLPKSIGKLHNLRVLNIMYALVVELPMETNMLHNLEKIYASQKNELLNLCGVKIQEGFSYLENLVALMHVEVHQDVAGFTKELEKLGNLKMLGISNLTKETSRAICDVSKKLNHLHTLLLSARDDDVLDLDPISSSPPPLLHLLYLSGRLNKFEFSNFTNLVVLVLRLSKMTENPLKCLRGLPNLNHLFMENSYEGEQLHFEEGSFPKINEIHFKYLLELKFIKLDKGTWPLLKILIIESCPLIEEVPSSIQYLTKLKKLGIWNMPK
ncbi:disease resistance protein RPM1-like [Humulus lupulus]|uniref:disease resistance protein RPM1-like n=1 Tax=Humulus lupulus TaxID=3486 RepID=UPI002B407168|nr:disease resistance protein RPM1-like [Humulus lupulus]